MDTIGSSWVLCRAVMGIRAFMLVRHVGQGPAQDTCVLVIVGVGTRVGISPRLSRDLGITLVLAIISA